MPVVINPDSELGRELAKWEKPYRFEPYPRMLYRARPNPLQGGKTMCGDPTNDDKAEAFTKTCQCIVNNEAEERVARGQGWALSPPAALELAEQEATDVSTAAAEANAAALKMTPKAQAERAKREAATDKHLSE